MQSYDIVWLTAICTVDVAFYRSSSSVKTCLSQQVSIGAKGQSHVLAPSPRVFHRQTQKTRLCLNQRHSCSVKKNISVAKMIHGGTADDAQPAIHGLLHAFVHLATDSKMEYLFQGSKKAMAVITRQLQRAKKNFEVSCSNRVRALACYIMAESWANGSIARHSTSWQGSKVKMASAEQRLWRCCQKYQ